MQQRDIVSRLPNKVSLVRDLEVSNRVKREIAEYMLKMAQSVGAGKGKSWLAELEAMANLSDE